jgi:hypothetical protein
LAAVAGDYGVTMSNQKSNSSSSSMNFWNAAWSPSTVASPAATFSVAVATPKVTSLTTWATQR